MKKGALTFEEPPSTKSPDSCACVSAVNQNQGPLRHHLKRSYIGAQKNCGLQVSCLLMSLLRSLFFLIRTSFVGLVALHPDAFFVHRGQDFGQEFAAESQFASPGRSAGDDVAPAGDTQ